MTIKLSQRIVLTLEAAKAIAAAAEQIAVERHLSVAIAIVDEGERLLYFQRMDNNANASVDVAIAKAVHAIHFRRPTKFHEDLLDKGNTVVLGVPGMVPLEGGLPLYVGEQIVGAIGISGARSDEDGVIAQAGANILREINK